MPTSTGCTNQQIREKALQDFVLTSDGRNLSLDEIRGKALQLKDDIAAEKIHLSQMPKNLPPEAAALVRNGFVLIQQKELVYNRIAAAYFAGRHQAAQVSQAPAAPTTNDDHIQRQSNPLGSPDTSQQQQQQAGQQETQPNSSQMNNNGGLGNQTTANGMASAQVPSMPQQDWFHAFLD
ncbi:hypothetical protein DFH11DRAFT_1206386 [Phellopilus nigrolimitatus]|nr:hypothetical protein DFH11DRAFT_1206386 [Phellopilus nigrolimitatus]